MKQHELRHTADGSHTVYSTRYKAAYHSKHGALRESLHVFIEQGLRYILKEKRDKKNIRILECGFGTGLNAWMTAIECQQNNRSAHYIGTEPHPLSSALIGEVNYPEQYRDGRYLSLWEELHKTVGESVRALNDHFSCQVYGHPVQEVKLDQALDLIYHDAFGPRVQPDLWEEPLMERYFRVLIPGGALVTFGAQGAFKRHLSEVGFIVEALPGPPGKREMTRAVKPNQS